MGLYHNELPFSMNSLPFFLSADPFAGDPFGNDAFGSAAKPAKNKSGDIFDNAFNVRGLYLFEISLKSVSLF